MLKSNSFLLLGIFLGVLGITTPAISAENMSNPSKEMTTENKGTMQPYSESNGSTVTTSNNNMSGSEMSTQENNKGITQPYSGNKDTKVYHKRGCQYFNCSACTVGFDSAKQAEEAGYTPCKVCIGGQSSTTGNTKTGSMQQSTMHNKNSMKSFDMKNQNINSQKMDTKDMMKSSGVTKKDFMKNSEAMN